MKILPFGMFLWKKLDSFNVDNYEAYIPIYLFFIVF